MYKSWRNVKNPTAKIPAIVTHRCQNLSEKRENGILTLKNPFSGRERGRPGSPEGRLDREVEMQSRQNRNQNERGRDTDGANLGQFDCELARPSGQGLGEVRCPASSGVDPHAPRGVCSSERGGE